MLAEAQAMTATTGMSSLESEHHWLRGELLLMLSGDKQAKAAACFHQAFAVARHQQARSYELRATTSLAGLWQPQGKCQGAYDLLAPVYNWFTEGFDTADLQEAKALLETLEDEHIAWPDQPCTPQGNGLWALWPAG
jgi:predicted ATPase